MLFDPVGVMGITYCKLLMFNSSLVIGSKWRTASAINNQMKNVTLEM